MNNNTENNELSIKHSSQVFESKTNVKIVHDEIAVRTTLNESIMLGQINYWLQKSRDEKHFRDGRYWVWKTYDEWAEELPFWSASTIRTIIRSLKNRGLVIVGDYNKMSIDKTSWYSIDYNAIDRLCSNAVPEKKNKKYKKESFPMCQHLTHGLSTPDTWTVRVKHMDVSTSDTPITKDYTKNTTKTPSESTKVLSISKENAPRITNRTEYMDFVRKVLEDSEEFNSCIDELCNGIEYFLVQYRMCKGKEHIRLKGITIVQIARALEPYKDDLREMIDKYFDTDFRLDYCGLSHFASESILELKGYEVGALGSVPVRNFV